MPKSEVAACLQSKKTPKDSCVFNLEFCALEVEVLSPVWRLLLSGNRYRSRFFSQATKDLLLDQTLSTHPI